MNKKTQDAKAEVREGEEPEVLPTLTMQFDGYTNCYVLVDEHGVQRALLRPAGESADARKLGTALVTLWNEHLPDPPTADEVKAKEKEEEIERRKHLPKEERERLEEEDKEREKAEKEEEKAKARKEPAPAPGGGKHFFGTKRADD